MRSILQAIKTIIIGGVVFLIPVIIVVIVLGKAFGLMMRLVKVIDAWIPIDTIGGVALVNILAVIGIALLCFIAGMVARSSLGKKIFHSLEAALLGGIPGYAFVKGFTDSMATGDKAAEGFIPVVAKFDDYSQIGFEVERIGNGKIVIYLPGAPNPWSGSLIYVGEDRVDRLNITVAEAIRNIRKLGMSSGQSSINYQTEKERS